MANVGDSDSSETIQQDDLRGVVETALAEALTLAAQAGRWELVAQIATELETRRLGRSETQPGGKKRERA